MSANKRYGVGLVMTLFGGAGLAENITSGRGSFMFCVALFSIGLAFIIDSYINQDE